MNKTTLAGTHTFSARAHILLLEIRKNDRSTEIVKQFSSLGRSCHTDGAVVATVKTIEPIPS